MESEPTVWMVNLMLRASLGDPMTTPQHDTFEYLRDALILGMKKGLVMISHEGLEEWGMQVCADWLKPVIPEIPVESITSKSSPPVAAGTIAGFSRK
jgi:hypothetical protein